VVVVAVVAVVVVVGVVVAVVVVVVVGAACDVVVGGCVVVASIAAEIGPGERFGAFCALALPALPDPVELPVLVALRSEDEAGAELRSACVVAVPDPVDAADF